MLAEHDGSIEAGRLVRPQLPQPIYRPSYELRVEAQPFAEVAFAGAEAEPVIGGRQALPICLSGPPAARPGYTCITFAFPPGCSHHLPGSPPQPLPQPSGTLRGTMPLNLVEAGAAAGRSKSSILRAIRRGALSATRDDTTGGWCIDEAELHRAFPPVAHNGHDGTSGNRPGNPTIRELQARIDEMQEAARLRDDVIDDLRRRLDAEADERRRLTALLTDQRSVPRRVWWWTRK